MNPQSHRYCTLSLRRGQGEEFQDELGLDWLDYGARMYDAQLGRFHVIDMLADTFHFQTPYSYAINNPIKYIDYMGLGPEIIPNAQFYIDVKVSFGPQLGGSLSILGLSLGFKLQAAAVEGSRRFYLQYNSATGWSIDTDGEKNNINYHANGSAVFWSGSTIEQYKITEHPAFAKAITEVQRLLTNEITTRDSEGKKTEETIKVEAAGFSINPLLVGFEVTVGAEGRYIPALKVAMSDEELGKGGKENQEKQIEVQEPN